MRHYQVVMDAKRNLPFGRAKEMLSDHSALTMKNRGIQVPAIDAVGKDDQIRKNIIAELHSEPTIDATAIEVSVDRGVVALRGSTAGVGDQWLIESAVRRISGVADLALELVAIQSDPGMRTDDDIRRDCEHALGLTVPGANHAIKVMVSSGWVTLSGSVAWDYERCSTEELVSRLMGVNGVNGHITVRQADEG